MKRLILGMLISLSIVILSGCNSNQEQLNRYQKDRDSANAGLNRVLTVYDQNGKVIKMYEGKFDIEWSDGGKVKFDLNGKRTIIYNGIVICDEK